MRILIVDDEPEQARQLSKPFGAKASCAGSCEEAVRLVRELQPDIVVLDAVFPLRSGRNQVPVFMAGRFLDELDGVYDGQLRMRPDVILVSGADEAAKHSAEVGDWLDSGRIADVLPKGAQWEFFQIVLAHKAQRIWNRRQLRPTFAAAEGAFAGLAAHGVITRDAQMSIVWKRLCQAARSGINTFIYGEVGVGKQGAVEAIAALRGKPISTQHCGAPPAGLFASLLFGTIKDIFNNAADRPGWIESAGKGILFLDELCSTPLECQPELLQVLESDTRVYSRLGENRKRQAECMFVCADNISPLEACTRQDEKRLLPALASRVSALVVHIPPLRDRRGDIPLLIEHFLERANSTQAKNVQFAKCVCDAFQSAEWRDGNVRQLKNRIESLVAILDDGYFTLKDISANLQDEERRLLERDLRIDLGRMPVSGPMAGGPPDSSQLLVNLRSEMTDPEPRTWASLASKQRERDHTDALLVEILQKSLIQAAPAWLERLLERSGFAVDMTTETAVDAFISTLQSAVRSRPGNDPASHLVILAALYLVLSQDHRANRSDLIRVLGRGYVQVKKVDESLLQLLPSVVSRVEEGCRKAFWVTLAVDDAASPRP